MAGDGRVAIITGSATGVGAATAVRLAGQGWRVVVNFSRSGEDAQSTAEDCRSAGGEAIVVQADVADDTACRALAQAAIDEWGRLDALVNNAARTQFVPHDELDGLDAADFQAIMAVNLIGPYQMIRAAVPHLRAAGRGAVVNISSIAGVTGVGSSIAYAASKGALNTMTLSLARALGPEIRVNAICPGMIQSRWLREGYGQERYDQLKSKMEQSLALKRVATPEDIADAVVWLIEGARLMTGEVLLIDGGQHLGYAPTIAR